METRKTEMGISVKFVFAVIQARTLSATPSIWRKAPNPCAVNRPRFWHSGRIRFHVRQPADEKRFT